MGEKILIVGNGGREHAIGHTLAKSSKKPQLFFAPGNPGTAMLPRAQNIPLQALDIPHLAEFAKQHGITLTLPGPEAPLAEGIVDTFHNQGLRIFGPTKAAALLESSKATAAERLERYGVPQPKFRVFSQEADALAFVGSDTWKEWGGGVVKADGLCAGKGVVVPHNDNEARDGITHMKQFGDAGKTIVIQQKIQGKELSVMGISDGTTIVPLLVAQDHKRLLDGNKGPNTGGMGAYAPVSIAPPLMQEIKDTILQPIIDGMKQDGMPFVGVLFAGLMLTKEGPKVLECNVRFGDPETSVVLPLLQSDLIDIANSAIDGTLTPDKIAFKKGSAACVVLASKGYPEAPLTGQAIEGLEQSNDLLVFHAGTKQNPNGEIVTNGGRVLEVVAVEDSLPEALNHVYQAVGQISFPGMQYRRDIGKYQ